MFGMDVRRELSIGHIAEAGTLANQFRDQRPSKTKSRAFGLWATVSVGKKLRGA
jgi:hypothetical protein